MYTITWPYDAQDKNLKDIGIVKPGEWMLWPPINRRNAESYILILETPEEACLATCQYRCGNKLEEEGYHLYRLTDEEWVWSRSRKRSA